jgi:outer membrane receptor protein involved in Fe transport
MKRILITVIIVACLAFVSSKVWSQDDTSKLENLSLKELLSVKVTTASRTAQELGLTPATVLLVTKEQIKIRGYQSLLDVLLDLPDIKVDDKMYSGMRNSFTIRGTQGSEKLVILLDGITISTPSGEALPIMENYPVHFAEQIEIVFGPASALYGANAVSGVINIISKKASSNKSFHVEASALGGTYGYTNTTLYVTKKISDNFTFVASGQYSHDKQPDYSKVWRHDSLVNSSSLKTGVFNTIFGPMAPETPVSPNYEAPLEGWNVHASIRSNNFTLSYFRNYTKVPTAYGNNANNAVFNKDVFMGQSVGILNATYKALFGKFSLTTMLTSSDYQLDPKTNYRNLYTAMEPGYKYSTCAMTKIEELFTWKASEKLNITAGAGFERYNSVPQSGDLKAPVDRGGSMGGNYLGTESYYRPEGLQAQFYHIKFTNAGAYFQTQYSPYKNVHFTIGARYDVNSRYGSTFNPRLGLVYKPFEKTTIKVLYGSAFLAPSPSDAYVHYGSFYTMDSGRTYNSYFLHLPNPGLKPIKSKNFELNLRQYITENLSFSVNGYFNELSNLYAFADDNETTKLYNNRFNGTQVDYVEVFVNRGKQHNYGGSLQLNWNASIGNVSFHSYGSVSYADGVRKSLEPGGKDVELDFISHFITRIGTDIRAGNFTCSPRLMVLSDQHIAGIGDESSSIIKRQALPGYALLNFSVRYTVKKGLSCFANVSNALDQRYRSVGFNMDLNNANTELMYGQPQDPARIMAGVSLAF